MVRKHTMSSFLLSIKLEPALASGSDTGPVPQNIGSWRFSDAPVPGMSRKPQRRQHHLSLELGEGKESSVLRASVGGIGA